jgi:hypothetical protein
MREELAILHDRFAYRQLQDLRLAIVQELSQREPTFVSITASSTGS